MPIRSIPLERELSERIQWFVKLRWLAVGGVLLFTLVGTRLITGFASLPLLIVTGFMAAYNTFFLLSRHQLPARWNIHLQVMLDWIALTIICHTTGGVDSPLIFFFIFHIILTSLLTSRRGCFLQGLLAITLISVMVFLESTQILPLPLVNGVGILPRYGSVTFLVVFLISFAAVIMGSVYLSTSVVHQLRIREERLLELQEDLSRSYQELLELDQAKTRFVRIVAHEIRAPMAATQSLLKVALDGYAGDINDKVRDLLSRSERRLLQLLDLVNELLDLVRGGQILPEEDKADINVFEAITRIVRDMEGRAHSKSITIDFKMPRTNLIFRGDEQDLERIFQNLIGNAIKYTPEDGRVSVIGRLMADNFLLFKVCDTGIGIPSEELNRIFDEFYRASNAKKQQKNGTGLGLSIVKKTAEKYGGRIEVKSAEGKGSCFSVYLPVITLSG